MPQPRKCIALYTLTEVDLWKEVEETVREKHDAPSVREGEVLSQALSRYLEEPGPLDTETASCPLCSEWVNSLSDHIRQVHNAEEINV